ncbi:GapA-binding peptide SR1P [Thermicanus aegyptius]|nr:GapA-binding peptide SR1P [Thermicanus aegyptius]
MGIIVCQKCNQVLDYVRDEKVTILYAVSEDHRCDQERENDED